MRIRITFSKKHILTVTTFKNFDYICSPVQGIGMWRSWLAHHVRDVGVVCSSQIIPTHEEADPKGIF